jgi:hypothetical protein
MENELDANESENEQPGMDTPANDTPANEPDTGAPESPDPHASSKALLDAISEPDPNAETPEEAEDKPDEEPEPEAAKPKAEAKTPEQEEAEMLDGVKSDRGKERIKAMLAGNRQLQADINEFRQMVIGTGMSPDQFAQTLEYGRLVNSANEADKHTALAMLDEARAELVKSLGIEAPGVDPLADFPELQKDVENMEIDRAKAIQLAKYMRREQQEKKGQQEQMAARQSNQEFQQQIQQATTIAEDYFKTREKEPDYPLKMRQIHAWFANEDNKREFVQNYEPKQWFGVFRMMYDNIKVIQPNGARPISSRPSAIGAPRTNSLADNQTRIRDRLDSMGI